MFGFNDLLGLDCMVLCLSSICILCEVIGWCVVE